MPNVKRALVTGASEGIGRALCLELAKAGYAVTGVARNQARLESLRAELHAFYKNDHSSLALDLSKKADVDKLREWLHANACDVFINNAGFGLYGNFAKAELDKLQEMLALNCAALMTLSHAFLESAPSGAALLNVASVAALMPLPHNAAYSATKAFVHNLTLSLWLEARTRGIYVGSLCPGYTETNFSKRAGGDPERAPRKLAATPESVARSTMKALKRRGSPVIVPGIDNRIMLLLARFLPQTWLVRAVGAATRKALKTDSR